MARGWRSRCAAASPSTSRNLARCGGSTGPRHVLPALPLFMLPIAFFADRSRLAFAVTLGLTVISAGIMLANVAVLVQQPQGDVFAMNPFYDIVVPKLGHGVVAMNTQDAFVPFGRADSSFNLGTLLGLSPRASLFVVVFAWAIAYVVPAVLDRTKDSAHA